jgi:glutamate/tyrosine decarboxylase-like PLP-dependent enzyme
MSEFPSGISRQEFLDEVWALERKSNFPIIEQNLFDEGPHLVASPGLPWGDEVRHLAVETYLKFIHGETWTTGAGALAMQAEIVSWMGGILGAQQPAGFVTSGGSESNMCALLAAKSRAGKGGSIVFPAYAHYSFYKACRMFGFEAIVVEAVPGSDCEVDPAAVDAAIRDDTIAVVATAGTWAYGSVDPVRAIGEIAVEHDVYLHVDACFGGYILPFLERSGYDPGIEPWDFRVAGVCSISADLHKNGMAPPPASTLFFRDSGYLEAAKAICPPNGTISGTRGAGPIAGAWAMIKLLGEEGYIAASLKSMELRQRLFDGIMSIDGLQIYPASKINVSLLYSDTFDLRPVAQTMRQRGWMFSSRDTPAPLGIVLVPMPQNERQIGPFLADLDDAMALAVPLRSGERDREGGRESHYGL